MLVSKGIMIQYCVVATYRRSDISDPDVEGSSPERWDGLRPDWGSCRSMKGLELHRP